MTTLAQLAARGQAAADAPSKPFCTDCDQRGREALLTRLIAGWRCPVCRRVTHDDVGIESGIVARVVVTGGGNG